MDTALIGFSGVIVGALVSFWATLIASHRQNEIALKTLKIEALEKKISRVEVVLHLISTVKMDVGTGDILPQQMVGHAMVAFTEKVAISQQCQHYLSKDLVDNINNLSANVGSLIFKGKTGEEVNIKETNEVFSKVQCAERNLKNEMQTMLKTWQLELDNILQA